MHAHCGTYELFRHADAISIGLIADWTIGLSQLFINRFLVHMNKLKIDYIQMNQFLQFTSRPGSIDWKMRGGGELIHFYFYGGRIATLIYRKLRTYNSTQKQNFIETRNHILLPSLNLVRNTIYVKYCPSILKFKKIDYM